MGQGPALRFFSRAGVKSLSLSAALCLLVVLVLFSCLGPALASVEGDKSTEIAESEVSFLELPGWLRGGVDHAHLRFRWTPINIVALALACTCALLANSAGIGGGPFYMPLLTSVLGFDIKSSTALSHTIVATSAVASTCYGLVQPSPVDSRTTLVDFTIALMFIPAVLFGVGLGVLGNALVPEWLQTAGLVALLSYVVFRTSGKAMKTWQHESALREKMDNNSDGEEGDAPRPVDEARGRSVHSQGPASPVPRLGTSQGSRSDMHELHAGTAVVTYVQEEAIGAGHRIRRNLKYLFTIIGLWVVFLALQLAMAQHRDRCTVGFAITWLLQTGCCLAVALAMVWRQSRKNPEDMDEEMRVMLLRSDEHTSPWESRRKLLKVEAVMVIAGAAAGLLGIGGALIFNPFLLALNVHPQVTASTSVMMILFSSSCISLSFYFQDILNTSYASVFAPACFLASLVGVSVIGRLVHRTGRASIIIFILTGLIAVGTVLSAIFGGMRSYEEIRKGEGVGFKPFCGK